MKYTELLTIMLTGQGCGLCGDLKFKDRTFAAEFNSDDGVVEFSGRTLRPMEDVDDCNFLCAEYFSYDAEISRIVNCSAESIASDEGETVNMVCVADGKWICMGGRHHNHIRGRPRGIGPTPAAAHLAREAGAEHASVVAFTRLAQELIHHSVPEDLVHRAHIAAHQEVTHARLMSALAIQTGGIPIICNVRPFQARSLAQIAHENAVEGCVHETIAALVAGWQAVAAPSSQLRWAAQILARDEREHAEYARDLHRWFLSRLTARQAAAVERARIQAWKRALLSAVVAPPDVRQALGLPDPTQVRILMAEHTANCRSC